MNASARSSIAKVTSPPSPGAGMVAARVAAQLGQHLLAQRQRELERQSSRAVGSGPISPRLRGCPG